MLFKKQTPNFKKINQRTQRHVNKPALLADEPLPEQLEPPSPAQARHHAQPWRSPRAPASGRTQTGGGSSHSELALPQHCRGCSRVPRSESPSRDTPGPPPSLQHMGTGVWGRQHPAPSGLRLLPAASGKDDGGSPAAFCPPQAYACSCACRRGRGGGVRAQGTGSKLL